MSETIVGSDIFNYFHLSWYNLFAIFLCRYFVFNKAVSLCFTSCQADFLKRSIKEPLCLMFTLLESNSTDKCSWLWYTDFDYDKHQSYILESSYKVSALPVQKCCMKFGRETAELVTALWCAARSGHTNVVSCLDNKKADVSGHLWIKVKLWISKE